VIAYPQRSTALEGAKSVLSSYQFPRRTVDAVSPSRYAENGPIQHANGHMSRYAREDLARPVSAFVIEYQDFDDAL
jgi:hypothetical protein